MLKPRDGKPPLPVVSSWLEGSLVSLLVVFVVGGLQVRVPRLLKLLELDFCGVCRWTWTGVM